MGTIILGALILAVGAGTWVWVIARKDAKKNGKENLGADWVSIIIFAGLVLGATGGAIGFGVNLILPAPPLPVAQRVVVENLLPFPKNNEVDPTIYAIQLYYNHVIRVQYNDGTTVKVGLCCDEKAPKIVDAEENNPSIKRYHRAGYRGWFSIRLDKTWYEVHLPKNTIAYDQLIPGEILR